MEFQEEDENVDLCLNTSQEGPELEFAYSVDDSGLLLRRPVHFDGVSPGQLCSFCDQEYTNIDDFLNQMKRFGYICTNCLDHFSDMPWFLMAERYLTYVKVGAVLASHLTPSTLEVSGPFS